MNDKTDLKQKIATYAFTQYRANGFSKISMDDIAKGMKISKKTIYKHFTSKEELVEVAFTLFMKSRSEFVIETVQKDLSSVVKLVLILQQMLTHTAMISTAFFRDIQNDLPELWKKFDEFRSNMLSKTIEKIYAQGIEEGYVKEFPVLFIVTILVASIREILKKEFLEQSGLTVSQALSTFYKFLLSTILTDKGKEEFSNLIYGVFQNEKF
jgi:AcrR family transcriptional regulator